ncbi:MAG: topoisomerase IV [Ruminococcaceae bacterium]|nr:topoisomerase IV [Oscillospiraceae bacterium]
MAENEQKLYREQVITDTLEVNYMPYAMSAILSRAIPEIDGFKPSHRKLLYTMYKKGLINGSRTKSANVVGETMKLNPHGDQAIYETMVRMTRGNGALLHPYVDSKGNFGKVYSRDMAFAAARYTEVKLEKICEEVFRDIDKNTVDFVDNYDGEMKEPVLLPVTFPTILANCTQGLAVGMATNICSFNLHELIDATCSYIDNPDCDLLQYIQAPDFSTGGTCIYNKSIMSSIIEKGRGSIKVRGKYRHDKKNSCIEIYEIPYTTTAEAIMDDIIKIFKEGKIKDIQDVRDETDINGLKITIDVKKSANVEDIMNKIYRFTTLQDSFACNFNVIVDGSPMVLGVRGILEHWLSFRMTCLKRQISYDIAAKKDRLHLLKGLEKILLDIDKAIKIIRETEKDDLVIPNLMWGFGIDEVQANFIAEIKLRNINKEYIINKIEEIDKLLKEIADLEDLVKTDKRLHKYIQNQLRAIEKKYAKDRLTDVIQEDEVVVVTQDQMIEEYNVRLFLTQEGYFKKIPLTALRNNPEHKFKEGDSFVQEQEWHNKSEVIFFSDRQNVYKMKIHDFADRKAGEIGDYLTNILGMEDGERVLCFVPTDDYKGEFLFGFANGKIAKVPMEAYATKNNRKKLINAYSDVSPIVGIEFFTEDIDVAICAENDRLLVVNSSLIPLKTTKSSQGVQVLKMKKGMNAKYMKHVDKCGFADYKVYRVKNIPVAGCFLKDADRQVKQLSLFDE